jgi:hypothetical protein
MRIKEMTWLIGHLFPALFAGDYVVDWAPNFLPCGKVDAHLLEWVFFDKFSHRANICT